MRRIAKPTDDPKKVFLICVSRVKDVGLKQRLESVAENVEDAAEEYDKNASACNWHSIDKHDNVAGVASKGEMEKVYIDRMAKKGAPGRSIYDRIRASASYGGLSVMWTQNGFYN